jgi:hypothetical protein
LFLNIEEASGWVAYSCDPEGAGEMEDYRIVVIRQTSGEVIYDSLVPLAANLCTHGFEMSPDDPRLQRLAQNVDEGIIEPLEAYQKSIRQELESTAELIPESQFSSSTKEVIEEKTAEKSVGKTSGALASNAPRFELIHADESQVILRLPEAGALEVNDRLFLREQSKIIKLPGMDVDVITSEGLVTGLIQVTSIDGLNGRAKILSGKAVEFGLAEKIIKP